MGLLTSHYPPWIQGSSLYRHLPLPVGGVGWPGATQWFHGHGQPLTSLVVGSEAGSGQEVEQHFLLPLAPPLLLVMLGVP